jgi:nicotinamidase-related amidase
MKSLIIVDFQYDFCNPKGSLYVEGAEKAKEGIIEYMKKNHQSFNQIIYTRDWHLEKDESFKKNNAGGLWPPHCVQNTEGAEVDKELSDELNKYKNKIKIETFNKGTVYNHEEYGAFEKIENKNEKNEDDINKYIFYNFGKDSQVQIKNNNIVVCGIAGDYCVMESIKNLLKVEKFKIEVLVKGVASIDKGVKLKEFMKEKKLEVAQ